MPLLLDTNVVSELRRVNSSRADPRFRDWAQTRPMIARDLISVVTLFEIRLGIVRVQRHDRRQSDILSNWLKHLTREMGDRILPVDIEVSLRAAELHSPDPAPERDAWIAATALVNGLTVATRNVKDFARFGVEVFDPWS